MAAPTTDNPPNGWSAILDYSKGMVTLAVALLGVTVTFADKLLLDRKLDLKFGLVVGSWALLVLTIVCGVGASIFSIQYLRNGTGEKPAVFFVNASFFAILGASVTFLLLGIARAEDVSPMDIEKTVVVARSAAVVATGLPASQWQAVSAKELPIGRVVRVELVASDHTLYALDVSPSGQVTSVRRIDPP